jgi:hypothetical protein
MHYRESNGLRPIVKYGTSESVSTIPGNKTSYINPQVLSIRCKSLSETGSHQRISNRIGRKAGRSVLAICHTPLSSGFHALNGIFACFILSFLEFFLGDLLRLLALQTTVQHYINVPFRRRNQHKLLEVWRVWGESQRIRWGWA